MKQSSRTSTIARYVASFSIIVAMWAGMVHLFEIPPYLLPDPLAVLETLAREFEVYTFAALYTFRNAILGGLLGVIAGLMVGGLTAYSRRLRWFVEPYLTVFQSFPREAFFPLMAVWLGFGMMPKVVNAILLSSLPMAVVTLAALIDTKTEYLDLMKSWRATKLQTFFSCRLPAAVPQLIGGIKVAMPLALIGAVLGEFLGGSEGLGHLIITSGSSFRVDRVFAAIIVLAVAGTVTVAIVDVVKNLWLSHYFQNPGEENAAHHE